MEIQYFDHDPEVAVQPTESLSRISISRVKWSILALLLGSIPAFAVSPHSCPAGSPLDTFRLLVVPAKDGPKLPVTAVNVVEAGDKLRYEPIHMTTILKKSSRVRIVIVPVPGSSSEQIRVLESKPVGAIAEWQVPVRASAVGVVFGPSGVSSKKVTAMFEKNPDAVTAAVEYSEQTSKVEALVQALSIYEKSNPSKTTLQSALQGFSTLYGVSLPSLSGKMSSDQQATLLLKALAPAADADHSVPSTISLASHTGGLAANVATMFFGSPFTLAMSGASFLEILHQDLFPSTDFRSAFTERSGTDDLTLCSGGKESKKPHTRLAYLWMLHIPDIDPPSLSLADKVYLPTEWTSTMKIACASREQLKFLPRARDWRLVSDKGETPVPVKVAVGETADELTLDLRQAKLTPGEYHLVADWDWSPAPVSGAIELRPFSDLSAAKVTPESQDHLITGRPPVPVELVGASFEFVDQVMLSGGKLKPGSTQLPFALPKMTGAGVHPAMTITVDTASLAPGKYLIVLKQLNGNIHNVPVAVHPPNPTLDRLPIRVNIGDAKQTIKLHGTGLERLDHITSEDAVWTLSPVEPGSHDLVVREATISLSSKVREGAYIDASLFVSGINAPISVNQVLNVAGPRPRVVGVTKSITGDTGVQLLEGELASGLGTSFALEVERLGSRPTLRLQCSSDVQTIRKLALQPGQNDGPAALDVTTDRTLFLAFDPGTVGQPGCTLVTTISNEAAGISDAYSLGRIIRLPKIDKFELSTEKVGDNMYRGTLTGQGLQAIEKTGWGPKQAIPVKAIPTPVSGNVSEQTLRINMTWPPPAPHAVLYIWLQGDKEARSTDARY